MVGSVATVHRDPIEKRLPGYQTEKAHLKVLEKRSNVDSNSIPSSISYSNGYSLVVFRLLAV